MAKNKVNKPIPTLDTVWKKKFMTKKQYDKINKHCLALEYPPEDWDEVEELLSNSIKIIKGLMDRATLLDVYKDITSDLYCTPNPRIIPPNMRKMFIFLGPEGKEVEEIKEWRVWREK